MPERVTDALREATSATNAAMQAARADAITPRQLHVAVDQCGLVVLHIAGLAEQWQRAASAAHRTFHNNGPAAVSQLAHLAAPGVVASRVVNALAALRDPLGDTRRRAVGLHRAFDHLTGAAHDLGHATRDINVTL